MAETSSPEGVVDQNGDIQNNRHPANNSTGPSQPPNMVEAIANCENGPMVSLVLQENAEKQSQCVETQTLVNGTGPQENGIADKESSPDSKVGAPFYT